jgi:hypothetical protein
MSVRVCGQCGGLVPGPRRCGCRQHRKNLAEWCAEREKEVREKAEREKEARERAERENR